MVPVNIEDLRHLARRRLPRVVFDFIDGGAQDERTLAANRADFEALGLRPRVLVDVAQRSLRTRVLGQEIALPFILAPTGLTGLASPKGELAAARAAERAGIPYCLSTAATSSIEEVAAATQQPFWFQLYVMRDRELTRSMIERAKAAGCSALVLTADLAVSGRRDRDLRNGFTVPPRITLRNVLEIASRPGWVRDMLLGPRLTFANFHGKAGTDQKLVSLAAQINEQFDQSVTWRDIQWCKSIWNGPVLVKGILTGDDARRAVDHGADGVIVSNHGGRQLDGVSSAIAALPEVAQAVGDRTEVLMDGGVRRGSDIVKALALGARAVLIGRAFLYGLAALGPSGAGRAIEMLTAELDNTLALLGVPSVTAIDASVIRRAA